MWWEEVRRGRERGDDNNWIGACTGRKKEQRTTGDGMDEAKAKNRAVMLTGVFIWGKQSIMNMHPRPSLAFPHSVCVSGLFCCRQPQIMKRCELKSICIRWERRHRGERGDNFLFLKKWGKGMDGKQVSSR